VNPWLPLPQISTNFHSNDSHESFTAISRLNLLSFQQHPKSSDPSASTRLLTSHAKATHAHPNQHPEETLMTTDKQIEANRANAQNSTGPNTAAGKAKVATNGLTHGLNSNPETLFAAHPDQEEAYRVLAQKLPKDCQPETAI